MVHQRFSTLAIIRSGVAVWYQPTVTIDIFSYTELQSGHFFDVVGGYVIFFLLQQNTEVDNNVRIQPHNELLNSIHINQQIFTGISSSQQ